MSQILQFRRAFRIEKTADLKEVAIAVDAIYSAHALVIEKLGDIEPPDPATGFRIHSLINLLGRTFEHAQAMLVAIATGSPASAEALARIVVEGSVNVTFLAMRGDAGTLVRFFRSWLSEHDKKLSAWKPKVSVTQEIDVPAMIEERRGVVTALETYLAEVESQCQIDWANSPEWPPAIFQRFQAIGRETDYYESYHRLSGSSHITGEDTLTWLLALEAPNDVKHKLAQEAWAYSTMMSRIASAFFVDAVAACCVAYKVPRQDSLVQRRSELVKAIQEIARAAGVPLDARSRSRK